MTEDHKPFALLFIFTSFTILLGLQFRWFHPLSVDIKYYFSVADYFFNHANLTGVGHPNIDYPPGAILYFLLLSLSLFISPTLLMFQTTFILISIFLLLGIFKVALDFTQTSKNSFIFYLIIICAGPIPFFRFDLLVIFLTILSLIFMTKDRPVLSGIFLGLATMTKIFPVVLLPFMMQVFFIKFGKFKSVFRFLLSFTAVSVFLLLSYMLLTGVGPAAIWRSININVTKEVHIESLLGTVLTVIAHFQYPGLHNIEFVNEVQSLTPQYYLGHLRIFRYLSTLSVAGAYILIFFKGLKSKRWLNLSLPICLFLLFVLILSSHFFLPSIFFGRHFYFRFLIRKS